ncbi:hypothetical protein Phab24_id142 [Acinetobacter phage Phab24]|nr:hypothetical protein Phab24_id142 [Acinetobacter phage Phab24]
MSQVNNNTSSGGIGFVGLLTIVFITLKLTGVITWSWWLVFLPMIISFGLWLIIMLGVLIYLAYKT